MASLNKRIFQKNRIAWQLEEKVIPIPLLVFHLVQAFSKANGFVSLITK